MTAEMILKKFYYLSIAEIRFAFDAGMMGEYGEVKKMDGTVLLFWLEKYDQDRTQVSVKINNELQLNNVYEAAQVFNLKHETTGKTLGQVFTEDHEAAMKKDKLRHIEADKSVVRPELPPFERLVIAEWDGMPYLSQGGILKVYKGEAIGFTEYREERLLEELENQTN